MEKQTHTVKTEEQMTETSAPVETETSAPVADKSDKPEQKIVPPRAPKIGAKPGRETKGGSPAQKAKAVKNEAEKKDAGAPGSLTKAQQTAVAASLATEPAGVKSEGTEKNAEVQLSDGSVAKIVAFKKLPIPRVSSTIALTGRPVTKRTKPAARWSAFMEFYNSTPAAERTVEAYILFSAKVAAGKVAGLDREQAPTIADLQWAAGKGWLVLV